jgi:hypothetical protein
VTIEISVRARGLLPFIPSFGLKRLFLEPRSGRIDPKEIAIPSADAIAPFGVTDGRDVA